MSAMGVNCFGGTLDVGIIPEIGLDWDTVAASSLLLCSDVARRIS